jgi:hypothetical protein
LLRHLADTTGGVLVDLNTTGQADALRLLSREVFSLLACEVVSGSVTGIAPAGRVPVVRDLSLCGTLASDRAVLKLSFGTRGRVHYTARSAGTQTVGTASTSPATGPETDRRPDAAVKDKRP